MALPNSEKITSQIAMLPDQALKQMAMMHKNDPYVLPLIISEDGRRKQMRQAAQAQMARAPQPKVADAAVEQMGNVDAMGNVTGYARGGHVLPEHQGIGQLHAPNIQHMADGGIAGYEDGVQEMATGGMFDYAQRSEPVLRMAGGGMLGYKNGGLTDKQEFAMQYKDIAEKVGKELGVDPGILISQWGLETAWGKKQVGQFNLGNIKDVSGKGPTAYDKMEKSRSSYKTYDSPDAFAADYAALIKRNFPKAVGAGSDISAFSAGLQQGEKGAYATDPNYKKLLANTFKNLPVSSATAEEVPGTKKPQAAAPVDTSLASQIPGQSYIAPAKKEPGGFLSSDWFEQKAEDLGLSRDVGRNVSNTLNAPTPMAPVTGVAKSGSSVSGIPNLLEKLGTKLGFAKVPGRLTEAEIAALQKESGGLRALEAGPKAVKGAQEAGATLEEQDYLRKMIEARQAKEAPSAAQKIAEASQAREAKDVATAQRLSQAGQEAQAAGRTGALADKAFPAGDAASAPVDPSKMPFKGISGNEMERMQEANQAPITRENVVDAAKEATPEAKRKGFTDDDLLTLGLSLLANKNPNFLTALGESGLAAVASKKEREKIEREEAKLKGSEELQKAQAKYYTAYGEAIERGAKEKNDTIAAEKMVQDAVSKWENSMPGKMAMMNDPNAKAREEERVRTAIFAQLGITPIMTKQSAAPSGGGGFKFLGVN